MNIKEDKIAYIVGLMLTDGWSYTKGNYREYSIELKKEDEDILLEIAKDFDCTISHRKRDTNFKKEHESTVLYIKDKELKDILNIYIPKENKTFTATIPEKYFTSPAFWRGMLDGDGCFGWRKNHTEAYVGFVTVNENFKRGLEKQWLENFGFETNCHRNVRDNVYNMVLTDGKAKSFLKWLTSHPTYGIERKTKMIKEILQTDFKEHHTQWTFSEKSFIYNHDTSECLKKLKNKSEGAIKNQKRILKSNPPRIFITGDTHRENDIEKFLKLDAAELTKNDLLIILGDWGAVWFGDERDNHIIKMYETFPCTVFVTVGNHDAIPHIYKYPLVDFCGDKAYKIGKNIYVGYPGGYYNIFDKTFLNINGADSTDKWARVEGESWWPEETITQEQIDNAVMNLRLHENKVDVILSHTGGSFIVNALGFRASQSDRMLDKILDFHEYKHHFCGHYHVDKVLTSQERIFYDDIVELI